MHRDFSADHPHEDGVNLDEDGMAPTPPHGSRLVCKTAWQSATGPVSSNASVVHKQPLPVQLDEDEVAFWTGRLGAAKEETEGGDGGNTSDEAIELVGSHSEHCRRLGAPVWVGTVNVPPGEALGDNGNAAYEDPLDAHSACTLHFLLRRIGAYEPNLLRDIEAIVATRGATKSEQDTEAFLGTVESVLFGRLS